MPIVNFVTEKKQVQVPEGANLREEAAQGRDQGLQRIEWRGASVNAVLNCHGLGTCGTCRVLITKGLENANPISVLEKANFKFNPGAALAYIGHEDQMALACRVQVLGDMDVQTCPEFNIFGENFFS